ncbi:McrB family protein [Acinetobacter rudis]|uniref:ATPase dynein-related AAA domain-containing protein n=1 Tax=Acinetobacter rudis CIP 110305 TaxID=421052 RepID=S3MTZ8_9GAMM|nr:AAA family ATPase [Acinetobacter rudis]EPF71037.1 hypothetical protein F945_02800 [Acinetobacter rudis CIP 110305]
MFNRACASCTLEVSTVVDGWKFKELVRYLEDQKIIEFPEVVRKQNWYQQNIYIVGKVRELFREKLEAGTTDLFYLNIFLWHLFAEKVATRFNAKSAVDYLKNRYPETYLDTVHIVAFKTLQGRELALDPKSKTPVIICDEKPPAELNLTVKKEYSVNETRHHHLTTHAKTLQQGNQAFSILISKLEELERFCDWYEDSEIQNDQQSVDMEEQDMINKEHSLNRILFGAAGTGKTYNAINHALSIIENKPLDVLENEDRTELKKAFNKYKDQGRIKFVTFHQSFSYEDFVEGIRAETDKQGNLKYQVEPGVFKEICEDAEVEAVSRKNKEQVPQEDSINFLIEDLIAQAKAGELTFSTKRGAEIRVTSNVAGTLFASTSTGSCITLSIRHIRNYLKDQSDIIVDHKSYEWAIAQALQSKVKYESTGREIKPYILIIDEINRGNISRIFGELITLIEDSKRKDAAEELSVTLPYSKEEFSVPQNLYIIGTMNSSDRSLTGLDIALRRRFTFIEMPPKPELLNHITIEGLQVEKLLKVMNQRIEVLLDRDHCIGHANFMSLKSDSKLDELAQIFKQKIIPQLQEYFFDDWAKINLVLFNNEMIIENNDIKMSNLFPKTNDFDHEYFEQKKVWKLNEDAFKNIANFKEILGPQDKVNTSA